MAHDSGPGSIRQQINYTGHSHRHEYVGGALEAFLWNRYLNDQILPLLLLVFETGLSSDNYESFLHLRV